MAKRPGLIVLIALAIIIPVIGFSTWYFSTSGATASEPAKVEAKSEPVDPPKPVVGIEVYLIAVNRTWTRAVRSCWDAKSESLLVEFPPDDPPDATPDTPYTKGWQLVSGHDWKELGNGTLVFLEAKTVFAEVAPDVTGLPCVVSTFNK